MSNLFRSHIKFVSEYLPEITSLEGLFLYSFVVYLFALFYAWMMGPTLEAMKGDLDKSNERLK